MKAQKGNVTSVGVAVAMIRGEGKNLRRKEKRIRIEQIRANLGLSDSQRTPMVLPSCLRHEIMTILLDIAIFKLSMTRYL